MTKKVRILGKKVIPVWLLVLALVAAAAGAASGTVLAGRVIGEVPVAVSQALLVGYPDNEATTAETVWIDDLTAMNLDNATQQIQLHDDFVGLPNRSFFGVKDDNTAFQAAAELATGDWVALNLPLKNASHNTLLAQLTLDVPEGVEVEVVSADQVHGDGNVIDAIRIGPNTWKLKVVSGAEFSHLTDILYIGVQADDETPPGFYTLSGTLTQIPY